MNCPTCKRHDEFVYEENTRVWRCDRCHERFLIKPRDTNEDTEEQFVRVDTTNRLGCGRVSISKHYNQPLFFGKDYSEKPLKPLSILYGRKHTFYVYYCRNQNCLRRIFKTWSNCPYCGQAIDWEDSKDEQDKDRLD